MEEGGGWGWADSPRPHPQMGVDHTAHANESGACRARESDVDRIAHASESGNGAGKARGSDVDRIAHVSGCASGVVVAMVSGAWGRESGVWGRGNGAQEMRHEEVGCPRFPATPLRDAFL